MLERKLMRSVRSYEERKKISYLYGKVTIAHLKVRTSKSVQRNYKALIITVNSKSTSPRLRTT